ncbi:MAG: PLP-dependent transferase, partial [Betaproteobacteria bacterium]
AEFLLTQPHVKNVYYPGLPSHHNHEIAKKQQRYFGGIIAFDLHNDSKDDATHMVCNTQLFKLAESLGGVKSLVCLPCEMTHKSIPREKRYTSGVTDSLVRLSVGLEDAEDLIDDLKQAFLTLNPSKQ